MASLRIQAALDCASGHVIIADGAGVIVFLNLSLRAMFERNASATRRVLPHFEPDRLGGVPFDRFDARAGHQRDLLGRLQATHEANIVVGEVQFRLIANPIRDRDSDRIGTVVERTDRTQDLRTESEVQGLVAAASAGELSGRISLEGKAPLLPKAERGFQRFARNDGQCARSCG